MNLSLWRLARVGKKAVILPFSYMAIIFVLSAIPGDEHNANFGIITRLRPEIQNLLHLPMYGALAVLWFLALRNFKLTYHGSLLAAVFISISYGFCDELHQYFVPGRYMSLLDVGFNLVGVALASLYIMNLPQFKGNGDQLV